MLPNEPNDVRKVRRRRPVPDECQHAAIFNFVHVQRQRPHRYSNHGLWMVEKLDGFGVQRKIVRVLRTEMELAKKFHDRRTITSL